MSSDELWKAAETYTWEQDLARGDWPTPRTAPMPQPPWPSPDNPMLAALLDQARQHIDERGVEVAMLQLATHCWFEGGIQGYDRGQHDARADQ